MTFKLRNIIATTIVVMASTAHAVVPPSSSSNTSLTGYWQNFTNPAETPVKLTDIPSGYKIVIIAFADMNSDGSVSFTLQGPPYDTLGEDQFKADIKTIQARGVKVLISLGGQNGIYQVDTTAKEKNYISSLSQIITTYGFDGIDYDFESGLSTANESYLLDATLQLKQLFNKLIVTMAPETIDVYWQVFPNGKYDQLIRTAGLVDLVEVQDYNSGCMPGIKPGSACYSVGTEDFIVSQADSTIQAWTQSGIANAASHYVIGLPATSQAAGSGYVDPSILNSALTCLKTGKECGTYLPTKTYPDIAGVMTWSINWDAKNNYAFEKAVAG